MTTGKLRQVDVNIPRFNQALVAALTGVGFVFAAWPVVAAVFVVVATTRLAGPRYGLFTQIYIRLVRPRLGTPVETEWAAPPRFAQLLSVVFLGVATALFAAGLTAAGWIVTLIVTALATLAATTRICVGCVIYQRFRGDMTS